MDNLTIFDMLYDNYKINKPIRLIECFAGYGSQALALKYLGVQFEHHKICEWATKSIQAYKDAHFTNDNTDYSKDLTQEQVIDYLFKKGISMKYNEPMTLDQIKRKGNEWQRTTYNNIIATHNLVNISQVKGEDLEITDTDKYDYILTYSFPCQDLSLAGKRAGMEKDSGTRSGLLWEVERILDECKILGNLPKILLMENVPEVVGTGNIEHFKKWREKLEQLGYSNYDQILNASDYEIPQNRRRCFMVSILGNYNYNFLQETPLKLKLKDLLEESVEEKYYLSQKMINCFMADDTSGYPRKERFLNNITRKNQDVGNAVTTLAGSRPTDNFVVESYGNKALVETLETNDLGDCVGVVVKETPNYIEWQQEGYLDIDCRAYYENGIAPTNTTTPHSKVLLNNLRIRKLTTKECFRLMGVKDEDYDNIAKNQSDASLYHLAGDSIVVNVLMAIFKQLL